MSLEQHLIDQHQNSKQLRLQDPLGYHLDPNMYPSSNSRLLSPQPESGLIAFAAMDDLPNIILANQQMNSTMTTKLQSIPDKVASRKQDFALSGGKMLLRDPSLRTNQEKAATLILE